VVFLYLFYVLFSLQIRDGKKYLDKRTQQNERFSQNGKRGSIFSLRKDGELVPLAYDSVWYKLIVSPKDIPSDYQERLFQLMSREVNLNISNEKFRSLLANKNSSYVELGIISKDEAENIEKLNLYGVYTVKSFKREYPFKEVGARVVGFVGGGEDGFLGRYGLEKFYNNDLSVGASIDSSFFSKIFKSNEEISEVENNKDIVTTLEPNVMNFLHTTLLDMKEKWKADTVSAIIMRPKTGEIVAMETVPGFDPNKYAEENVKNFSNPSVSGVYELGSIMKPITMSSAINEGLVTPQTVFHDKGFVKIDNYTIKNFDEKVRGDVTMQDVISQSLNTGIVFVQRLLGKEKFKEYFEKSGLSDTTGIDFPNEAINLTDNLDTDTDVNFATAAFGQGVAVTPIGMLTALSIITNRGKTICPHFLNYKLFHDNFKSYYECENEPKEVIKETSADTAKKMMIELIETGLAHGRYKDQNYYIGAKTGTAQLPSPDGKYYKDKFIHSYFTFFPGTDPEFSVLIYQVNPKEGMLASMTLAPYATKIKDFLLEYYSLPPDKK
jgi:cell division protein FtsI/penicillin-binding protein 2